MIDSDNQDELTSSGVSEDEDFEEEEIEEHQCKEGKMNNTKELLLIKHIENTSYLGNILQPITSCLNARHVENVIETQHHINNDQLIAQAMAVLAAKYQYVILRETMNKHRSIVFLL